MKKLVLMSACLFLLSSSAHAGLVAHWSFNEGSFDEANNAWLDETKNGNDLAVNGDPQWEKGALKFNGDDYLEALLSEEDSDLALGEYTVCVRFKTSDKKYHLITRGTWEDDTQHHNFFLRGFGGEGRMTGGHEIGPSDDEVKVNTAEGSVVSDDRWHEVWLTYDGAALRIYRDGVLDDEKDNNVAPPGYASGDDVPVRIGGNPAMPEAATHWLRGYIDDIKIYDEALLPPVVEIISAHIDYGFGGNMNHFYTLDFMRFNIDYTLDGGDPEAEYKVFFQAHAMYPKARGCKRRQKRNSAYDYVQPGQHTFRFSKLIPRCAEPPAVDYGDWIDVKWTGKVIVETVKLVEEGPEKDRNLVLSVDKRLRDEAFCVHSSTQVYKGY